MMATTGISDVACTICGTGLLEELVEYRRLRRVTSDCRAWPAGGRLGVCRACAAVQKPADAAFLAEIDDIYSSYTIYHQAAGAEQAVFEQSSGLPASRSLKLLDTFREHAKLVATGRMLDVGCGNGATIRAFGQVAPGWTKAGTEFDTKYRAEVESIPLTESLHVGPVETVPGSFDVITMIHVLEHIVEPVSLLDSLRRKLSPGGLLLIEVPHHPANPFELLIADHRTHFTSDSLTHALAAAGFEVVAAAEDWIPKELSVIARPALATRRTPRRADVAAARARVARSLAWLGDTANRIRSLAIGGPVGLFGTSIAGTWLASEADNLFSFFVDEDPYRAGRTYLGKPVHAPADIPQESRVFVGLPPALAAGICARLARPGVEFIPPG
jgi:2-polyprenyl-3-methyl-5-hydroxy-6-metoxy-1,4-benzoquinol methylase